MSHSSILESLEPIPVAGNGEQELESALSGFDSSEKIQFSATAKGTSLRPYWNFCSAAGRANEGLRAGWREHLKLAAEHCGIRYLRFHGLLHDDMFVCRRQDG